MLKLRHITLENKNSGVVFLCVICMSLYHSWDRSSITDPYEFSLNDFAEFSDKNNIILKNAVFKPASLVQETSTLPQCQEGAGNRDL